MSPCPSGAIPSKGKHTGILLAACEPHWGWKSVHGGRASQAVSVWRAQQRETISLRLSPNIVPFRLHPPLPPSLPLYNGEWSNDFQQCCLNGSGPILDCNFFFFNGGGRLGWQRGESVSLVCLQSLFCFGSFRGQTHSSISANPPLIQRIFLPLNDSLREKNANFSETYLYG